MNTQQSWSSFVPRKGTFQSKWSAKVQALANIHVESNMKTKTWLSCCCCWSCYHSSRLHLLVPVQSRRAWYHHRAVEECTSWVAAQSRWRAYPAHHRRKGPDLWISWSPQTCEHRQGSRCTIAGSWCVPLRSTAWAASAQCSFQSRRWRYTQSLL